MCVNNCNFCAQWLKEATWAKNALKYPLKQMINGQHATWLFRTSVRVQEKFLKRHLKIKTLTGLILVMNGVKVLLELSCLNVQQ